MKEKGLKCVRVSDLIYKHNFRLHKDGYQIDNDQYEALINKGKKKKVVATVSQIQTVTKNTNLKVNELGKVPIMMYHGIIDTKKGLVVFNTEETILTYEPYSSISMLAITADHAYEICVIKDGSCKDSWGCTNTNYNYILDLQGNKCLESCLNDTYEYNNICYNKCPKGTLVNNNICRDNLCLEYDQDLIECLDNTPKGYYLDFTDEIYICFKPI